MLLFIAQIYGIQNKFRPCKEIRHVCVIGVHKHGYLTMEYRRYILELGKWKREREYKLIYLYLLLGLIVKTKEIIN